MSTNTKQKDLVLRAIQDYLVRRSFLTELKNDTLFITRPEMDKKKRFWASIGHTNLIRGSVVRCGTTFQLSVPNSLERLAVQLKYCGLNPISSNILLCEKCKKLHKGT